jgi:hypothetical protein
MRFLNPGSFGIVILCFFLPFVNIKCNNMKLASMTGIQMATGTNIGGGGGGLLGSKLNEGSSSSTKVFEIPLLVTLALLIAAGSITLILTLRNTAEKKIRNWTIIGHAVVLGCLLLELVKLEVGMKKAMSDSDSTMPISITWGLEIGYWLALIIPIGFIIYNVIELKKIPQALPLADNTPPAPPFPGDGSPNLPQS